MTRKFVPLEGYPVTNAGPNADESGFMVTLNGQDIVDFSARELQEMMDRIPLEKVECIYMGGEACTHD